MPTLTLRVSRFESDTLADDLGKLFQAQIEGMPPEQAQSHAKELDAVRAMIGQATELATAGKMKGEGTVQIEVTDKGGIVHVHTEAASSSQNFDPRVAEKLSAAQAAKAKAAARKIVAVPPPPKPAGTFARADAPKPAPATSQVQKPATPAPGGAPSGGASKGSQKGGKGGGAGPTSRPTIPPPRRS